MKSDKPQSVASTLPPPKVDPFYGMTPDGMGVRTPPTPPPPPKGLSGLLHATPDPMQVLSEAKIARGWGLEGDSAPFTPVPLVRRDLTGKVIARASTYAEKDTEDARLRKAGYRLL